MADEPAGGKSGRERPFDNEVFFAALDAERIARSLHWKAVASESGVSASTLTRIGQGKRPDVDSFAALVAWAGLDAERFFKSDLDGSGKSSLAGITILLRRDPHLSADAAAAIDELVKATYQRLKRE